MKTLICAKTGQSVRLLKPIAKSGEGTVWQTSRSDYLAKVYFEPTPERVRKLELMIQRPPEDPNAYKNHVSFAWATTILTETSGKAVGFLMPAIKNSVELIEVYSPIRRKKLGLDVNWRFLHVTALNIASIIAAIHHKGYVIGDIKPQNILVNNQALPSIIDTDSFQVQDPQTQKTYPCLVGTPEFTPPELIGENLANVTQTQDHDNFRLGVIIYYLLFGNHPFQGKWRGGGDPPITAELVQRGIWLYSSEGLLRPVARNIPIETVHPELRRLFWQCFNEGHLNPSSRPTAQDWFQGLKAAFQDLKSCQHSDNHYYSHLAGKCYWCERAKTLGIDVFDHIQTVRQRRTVPPRQTVQVSQFSSPLPVKATVPSAYPSLVPKTASLNPVATTSLTPAPRTKSFYWVSSLFAISILTSVVGSILVLRHPLEQVTSVNEASRGAQQQDWRESTGVYRPLVPNEYKQVRESVQWVQ